MGANEFFIQKRAAGSPNNGVVAFMFGFDTIGHVHAEPFVTAPEDASVQEVCMKRASASPNNSLVAFFMAMDDQATPATLIRGDIFGNTVSNQKERGGL